MDDVETSAEFVLRSVLHHWAKLAIVGVVVFVGSYVVLGALNRQTYEANALVVLDRSSNQPGHRFPLSINDFRTRVEVIAREDPDLTSLSEGRQDFSTGVVSRAGGFPVLSLRVFDGEEERALETLTAWLDGAITNGVEIAHQDVERVHAALEEQYAHAQENELEAKTAMVAFREARRNLATEIETRWENQVRNVRLREATEKEGILARHKQRLHEVAAETCAAETASAAGIDSDVRRMVSLFSAAMDASVLELSDPALSVSPTLAVNAPTSELRESICEAATTCCGLPEALDAVIGEARLAVDKLRIERRYERRHLNRHSDDEIASHRDMTSQLALPLEESLKAARAEVSAIGLRLTDLRAGAPKPEDMVRVLQEPRLIERLSRSRRLLLAGLSSVVAAGLMFLGLIFFRSS